jgi:hypothetical protein
MKGVIYHLNKAKAIWGWHCTNTLNRKEDHHRKKELETEKYHTNSYINKEQKDDLTFHDNLFCNFGSPLLLSWNGLTYN